MVSGTVRRTAAVAGALTFAGGGAVIAYAQTDKEPPCTPHAGTAGLSLCALDQDKGDKSITINRRAQAGADKLFVVNSSKTTLNVTAKARPWTQSASGVAIPNRRGTLGGVALDAETFTLAPGTRKEVTITLNSVPSSGYLYGALEVVGLPADLDQRKGVVTGYRLVNALRYTPAAPSARIKAGAVKVVGSGWPARSRCRSATPATRLIPSAARSSSRARWGPRTARSGARASCRARVSGSRCCPATRSSPAPTRPRSRSRRPRRRRR